LDTLLNSRGRLFAKYKSHEYPSYLMVFNLPV